MKDNGRAAVLAHTEDMMYLDAADFGNAMMVGSSMEFVPQVKVVLTEPIDVGFLQEAVQAARIRYRLLRRKFCVLHSSVVYMPNEKDVVISNEPAGKAKLLGAPNNDYPWKVTYFQNYFVFTWAHGMCDGRGGFEVVKTILYYYYTLAGLRVEDTHLVKTLDDDMGALEPLELEHSYNKHYGRGVPEFNQRKLPDVDVMSKKYRLNASVERRCCLTFSTRELLDATHRFDTTPYALLAPLLARSLKCYFDEPEPNIGMIILVDARGVLGSQTLRNCTLQPAVCYESAKMDGRDMEMVATILRSLVDLAVEEGNALAQVDHLVEFMRSAEKIKPLRLRMALIHFLAEKLSPDQSASIVFSNVGLMRFPSEITPHVQSVSTSLRCYGSVPTLVELSSTVDVAKMEIAYMMGDCSFAESLMDDLGALGVHCAFEDEGEVERNRFFY